MHYTLKPRINLSLSLSVFPVPCCCCHLPCLCVSDPPGKLFHAPRSHKLLSSPCSNQLATNDPPSHMHTHTQTHTHTALTLISFIPHFVLHLLLLFSLILTLLIAFRTFSPVGVLYYYGVFVHHPPTPPFHNEEPCVVLDGGLDEWDVSARSR